MSRRDNTIVAWHEVPGTAPPSKGPSRRVRYDLRGYGHRFKNWREEISNAVSLSRVEMIPKCIVGSIALDHTVPYGTTLLVGCPRHFVPGYDRAVPLGRKRFRAEALIKLCLRGKSWAQFSIPRRLRGADRYQPSATSQPHGWPPPPFVLPLLGPADRRPGRWQLEPGLPEWAVTPDNSAANQG